MSKNVIYEKQRQHALDVPICEVFSNLSLGHVSDGDTICSPFRSDDRNPSLQVGGNKNICYDYATGEKWNTIDLVMSQLHCDYPEAVQYLLGIDGGFSQDDQGPEFNSPDYKGQYSPIRQKDTTQKSDAAKRKQWDLEYARSVLAKAKNKLFDSDRPLEVLFQYGLSENSLVKAPIGLYRNRNGRLEIIYADDFSEPTVLKTKSVERFKHGEDGIVKSPEGKRIPSFKLFPKEGIPLWFPFGYQKGKRLLFAGGEEKALLLHEIFPEDTVCSSLTGEGSKLKDFHLKQIQDADPSEVIVVFDADDAGKRGACAVAKQIQEKGVNSSIVIWDRELPVGYDVNNLFLEEGADAVVDLLESASKISSGRDSVLLMPYEDSLATRAAIGWNGLKKFFNSNEKQPKLVMNSGIISELVPDGKQKIQVRFLGAKEFRARLNEAQDWQEESGKYVSVPTEIADYLFHHSMWHNELPLLTGVSYSPVFAPCGRLISSDGYDKESGLYLSLAPSIQNLDIPTEPSAENVEHAINLLLVELLGDFPFVRTLNADGSKVDADKANTLCLILEPFVREMIQKTPLYILDKPVHGTGASLLAKLPSIIADGVAAQTITMDSDEKEFKKTLFSHLLTGSRFTFIDNVEWKIKSPTLASMLTEPEHTQRLLTTNKMGTIRPRCSWIATGNNVVVNADIVRRSIRIRMDAGLEQPWTRTGWRHPNLLQWVGENRRELIWAALVLVQSWIRQGMPAGKKKIGSFENWCEVMGGILESAGIGGFLGNLDDFYSANGDASVLGEFIQLWWDAVGSNPIRPMVLESYVQDLTLFDHRKDVPKQIGYKLNRDCLDRVFKVLSDGGEEILVKVLRRTNSSKKNEYALEVQ